MEEEIICSCQHWTQREALKDSGPDKSDPRQNAIANTSGRAKHSAFVSHLKVRKKSEGIKLSEGSTQAASQLQILWSPNHWMTQSNLSISEQAKCWKGCGRFRSFMSLWPLGAFLVLLPVVLSSPSTHTSCRAAEGVEGSVTSLETWLPKAMIIPQSCHSGAFDFVDY